MTSEYRLGEHTALRVGAERVAMISRETRGWAMLSLADYARLTAFFDGGAAPADGTSGEQNTGPGNATGAAVLERLHSLGLVLRDGRYADHAYPKTPAWPESVLLKMTGHCNLRCTYCYDWSPDRARHVLATSRAKETIDAIVAHTGKLTITFHGGEPLLRLRDIEAIVDHCRELQRTGAKIRYALQTNGSLLDAEAIAFLDANKFSVGISLDGLWHETDALRRGGREAPSALFERLLREHGDFVRRRCGVLAVVCRSSARRLPEFALWLQAQGIGGLSTTVLDHAGRAEVLDDELVTADDLVELYRTWLRLVIEEKLSSLALTNLIAYIDNLYAFDPPSFCQKGPCGAAGDFLVVDADGSFRACDCVIHDFFVLGTSRSGAADVLRPSARRHIHARHAAMMQQETCVRCPWIRLCGGTCVAKALGRSDGIDQIYSPECAVNRFLYPALLQAYADDPEGALFRYHRTHSRLSLRAARDIAS